MQFYYGEKNILRALDEAEFWKHQEAEHTQVIRAVTPDLEACYTETLIEYEAAFDKIHGYLVRLIQSSVRSCENPGDTIKAEMTECVAFCIKQSSKFVQFLDRLLIESEAVGKDKASSTVIKHIIRESQYFIGIDQLILFAEG